MKGLYDNEMKLEFKSKTSNEAFARITVAAFVSGLDITIDDLSDIKTAISEAVTNSIIHGYENEDGIVKINARIFGNTVEIEIIDNGKGIEDIELARKRFGDRLSVLESSPGFIEFNAPDTDKGTGLMHLADSLGIDRKNTIAIGDSPLDVPMIRAAGLGIAVDNAHDTAKSAAKIQAPDCDDDAVAWVIDNIILKDI